MTNSWQKYKAKFISTLSSRWVRYFEGNEFYSLQSNDTKRVTKEGEAKVTILSRQCYRVIKTSFPIKAKTELLKVIKPKYPGCLYWVGPWHGNQRRVEVIKPAEQGVNLLKSSRFVIPEHWLFSAKQNERVVYQLTTPGGTWFSYKREGESETLVQGGIVQSAQVAKANLGVSDNEDVIKLAVTEYFDALISALTSISPSIWGASRWQVSNGKKKDIPIKVLGATVAIVVVGYLAFSSLYLSGMKGYRSAQLTEYGDEISQKLEQRQSTQSSIKKIRTLSSKPMEHTRLLNVWDIVGFLYLNDVTINQLSSDFSRMEVRGVVESATDLVEKLSDKPTVSSVSFSSPVRSSRNGEVFNIEIQLKGNNG